MRCLMSTRELQKSQEVGEKGEYVAAPEPLSRVAVGHWLGSAGPLINAPDDFSR